MLLAGLAVLIPHLLAPSAFSSFTTICSRRVLRDLPHGRPFCPATNSQVLRTTLSQQTVQRQTPPRHSSEGGLRGFRLTTPSIMKSQQTLNNVHWAQRPGPYASAGRILGLLRYVGKQRPHEAINGIIELGRRTAGYRPATATPVLLIAGGLERLHPHSTRKNQQCARRPCATRRPLCPIVTRTERPEGYIV